MFQRVGIQFSGIGDCWGSSPKPLLYILVDGCLGGGTENLHPGREAALYRQS